MRALAVWKLTAADHANFLEELVALLAESRIRYCVIGGQGVNAYVDPLIGPDLHIVVAADQLELMEALMRRYFTVERFPHSLNISKSNSNLRVQIQTDPRYLRFPEAAEVRDVLGLKLPVARIEDLLQGNVWAALDSSRRPSKRRKDLLDIERLQEAYPELRQRVPAEIIERIERF